MRFVGRLYLENAGPPGLPVALDFQRDHLLVVGEDEPLGSWALPDVWLEPMGDGRFTLSVGDDRLLLVPEDPLELEYQVIPLLERVRRGGTILGRFRSWVDTQLPSLDTPMPSPPEPLPPSPTEPTVSSPAVSPVMTLTRPEPHPIVPEDPGPRPRCAGLRRDGEPCRSPVIATSGYCFAHDPGRTDEERRLAHRRAPGPLDPEELSQRLAQALADLQRGRLDPATATAMAELIRTMWIVDGLGGPPEPPEARPEVSR